MEFNMKSDMVDATVFNMIEIGGDYGVQKEMKKVLEKGRCRLSPICGNSRERIESLMTDVVR
jgi:hypothetical protein